MWLDPSYTGRVVVLAAIALPSWIVWRCVLAISDRGQRAILPRREMLLFTIAAYAVIVAAATVLPLPMSSVSGVGSITLIPGVSTYRCFTHKGDTPSEELIFCIRNLLGNILLFVPFGLLLPVAFARFASLRPLLQAALAVSIGIEAVQLAERLAGVVRSVDIDDVILNLIGACIGYGGYMVLRRLHV